MLVISLAISVIDSRLITFFMNLFAFSSDKSHQYCGFSVNGIDAGRKTAAHRLGCDLASRLIKLGALDIVSMARKQNEES